MTTNVPKGANRAGAQGKRSRASQKAVALPPKSEAARQAHTAEIEAARIAYAAHAAKSAQADSERLSGPMYDEAHAFTQAAEAAGWSVNLLTSWQAVAVLAQKDGARLLVSWREGKAYRTPLLTTAEGRNVRLPDYAAALRALV